MLALWRGLGRTPGTGNLGQVRGETHTAAPASGRAPGILVQLMLRQHPSFSSRRASSANAAGLDLDAHALA
jgi:hypothetical protein